MNKEINATKIEVVPCKDAQNQNNVGCREDYNADCNEARDDEFESYVAEVEEALLAEIAEEDEFEYFMARAEDYADMDDLDELEVA